MKILGAAYLCWIGVKALWSIWFEKVNVSRACPSQSKRTLQNAFLEGFLTNAFNPKVSMFSFCLSSVYPDIRCVGAAFFLVFVRSFINLMWFSATVLLFSQLIESARSQTFQKILKTTTGFIFIGFGVKLAFMRI